MGARARLPPRRSFYGVRMPQFQGPEPRSGSLTRHPVAVPDPAPPLVTLTGSRFPASVVQLFTARAFHAVRRGEFVSPVPGVATLRAPDAGQR